MSKAKFERNKPTYYSLLEFFKLILSILFNSPNIITTPAIIIIKSTRVIVFTRSAIKLEC